MTVAVEVGGTGLEEVEAGIDFQMIGFPMVVEEVVVATGVERDGDGERWLLFTVLSGSINSCHVEMKT